MLNKVYVNTRHYGTAFEVGRQWCMQNHQSIIGAAHQRFAVRLLVLLDNACLMQAFLTRWNMCDTPPPVAVITLEHAGLAATKAQASQRLHL
jgi:hypothetical protein